MKKIKYRDPGRYDGIWAPHVVVGAELMYGTTGDDLDNDNRTTRLVNFASELVKLLMEKGLLSTEDVCRILTDYVPVEEKEDDK